MRKFWLRRLEDETGISGIGIVTEGVEFSDGSCVMRWITETSSVAFYKNIEDVLTIHGYGGKTGVIWEDEETKYLKELPSDRQQYWTKLRFGSDE